MTTRKLTIEQEFAQIRRKAKKLYNEIIDFRDTFAEYIGDDMDDINILINDMHRLRKSLKNEIKDKKTGKYYTRPTTMEYLKPIKGGLKEISDELASLMEAYTLSDEDSS